MPINCQVTWMNFYGERGMAEMVKKRGITFDQHTV